MENRLDELETRITYQEAAIDALTASSLAQERQLATLQARLDYLQSLLKDLTPSAVASRADETPPPHY